MKTTTVTPKTDTARQSRAMLKTLELKARVRALGALYRIRLDRAHYQATGFTWRGWWYPSWLVGALCAVAILAAFGLLAWGVFTHPILGA